PALYNGNTSVLSRLQQVFPEFTPGKDGNGFLGCDSNGIFISEVDGDSLNVIAWQIRLEDSEVGNCFWGNAPAAGFFPGCLRIQQCNGMSPLGEQHRSPRSGGTGTNHGYMHDVLNIAITGASMLAEDSRYD